MIDIRPAQPNDAEAIRRVLLAAFPTPLEADLVARLCANGNDELGLVAEIGDIVGHILFSPVTIQRDARIVATGLGLAPVAVEPAHQRRGIGGTLIRAGLAALQAAACPFVVVLGEPAYYQRFGFATASRAGLQNEYGVDEPFMVIELTQGALPRGGGLAKYGPEFADLG